VNLGKAVGDLEERYKALASERDRLASLLAVRQDVRPGDVWMYVPNYKPRVRAGVYEVESVNQQKNRVKFVDGGWNDLKSMSENPNWVLLGRTYRKGDERQVARKRGIKR
jgi:hypothetical protein